MGMHSAWSREHKVASVIGAEVAEARVVGDDRGAIAGGRKIMEGLVDCCKDWLFLWVNPEVTGGFWVKEGHDLIHVEISNMM